MDLRDSEIEILESTRSAVPEIGRSANLRITILTDPAIQRFIDFRNLLIIQMS